MNKLFLGFSIGCVIFLSGCQTIEQQATSIGQQGQETINSVSEQVNQIQNQAMQTKAAFEEKSQEVVNTMNDINQLSK